MSGTWEDVFVLFDAAQAMPDVERDVFLARECGPDARLRIKVESLLEAHRDAGGFLSSAALGGTHVSDTAPVSVTEPLPVGTRIGVFEIESFAGLRLLPLRLLGVGDQILALLLLGQHVEQRDDRLQFLGIRLHELASFDRRPHFVAPLRP